MAPSARVRWWQMSGRADEKFAYQNSFFLLFVLPKGESVRRRTCFQYASEKTRCQGSPVLIIVPFLWDNMSPKKAREQDSSPFHDMTDWGMLKKTSGSTRA